MTLRTSRTLLQRIARTRDGSAWDEFDHKYRQAMLDFARRQGASEHTAEQAVQDAMVAVVKNNVPGHHDPQRRFRNLLFTIVARTVGKAKRLRRAQLDIATGAAHIETKATARLEVILHSQEEARVLRAAQKLVRAQVSPAHWQAFELLVVHGRNGDEVSVATGLRKSSVYKAKSRVAERLRELLHDFHATGQIPSILKPFLD